ncbi:MAG: redoxin domain-containing protein [Acidobacteriota bacterium]
MLKPTQRFTVLLAVALVAGLAGAQPRQDPLPIGEALPEAARQLERAEAAGGTTSLEELRRPAGLLVIFSANTCAYVADWLDRYPRLAAQAAELDVGFALINSNERRRRHDDSAEAMASLQEERFAGVPYLVDEGSTLANLLGATRTPEAFLFDGGDLKLVYRGLIDDHSGPFAEVTEHYARDALSGLGSGLFPEPTAPIGCSVLRARERRKPSGP